MSDWRDRLEKCCGNKPEVYVFDSYMTIKCRLKDCPSAWFIACDQSEPKKITELWKSICIQA